MPRPIVRRQFRRPTQAVLPPELPNPPSTANIPRLSRVTDPAQRWAAPMGGVTPERLFFLLAAAARGEHESYLTLAQEIEEKYLHYASQLQTRKLAIIGEEMEVAPGDDSAAAQEIADTFLAEVVEQECFADFLLDLLDALSKGYAVVQPHWDTTARPWRPVEYEWFDPRFFVFDRATLKELRLRDDASGDPDGRPLPPGLIVHRPRVRSGVTVRSGLARPAAVAYLFQTATIAQWAVFSETFGMPLRLAKYDPATSTEEEISQLRTALINIGHNAAAMIPLGMEIEFPDARRPTSGDNVYKEQAQYWAEEVSKLVLGQTMTSDSTGQRGAQAEVHNDVRLDIKRADARQLCGTLRQQLVKPWVLYNYGPDAPLPKLRIAVDPPEDLQSLSLALAPLIKAGLRVRAQEVRDRFGLAEPKDGDEVIEPMSPPLDPNKPQAPPMPPNARTGRAPVRRGPRRGR